MAKYLAILPSNQIANRYSLGNTNEMAEMIKLAGALKEALASCPDIEAEVIVPHPQVGGSLANLYAQIANGVNWLRARTSDKSQGALLSLHSDSGYFSHIFKIYGGWVSSPSYRLADRVGDGLEEVMQTGDVRFLDYSDYAFYTLAQGWPSALIECGSHQNAHDLEFLLNKKDQMAAGLARGVAAYFNVPMRVQEPETPDVCALFSARGVPCNPEAAIFKHWLQCYRTGEIANLGPALRPEEPGEPYGEPGCIVQFFESGIVVCKPHENWKCYHAQIVLDPKRWGLAT